MTESQTGEPPPPCMEPTLIRSVGNGTHSDPRADAWTNGVALNFSLLRGKAATGWWLARHF